VSQDFAALLYLGAAVLFILSIRGLASPRTARRGNYLGMIGMAIVVVVTLLLSEPSGFGTWALILLGALIGSAIGALATKRVPMTAMPQMVSALNSTVGLAAVLVAAATLYAPAAFDIGVPGDIATRSLIEMSIGLVIGAVTFTGSVLAGLKLHGTVSGQPIGLPGQKWINLGLILLIVVLIAWFVATESPALFWLIAALALLLGVTVVMPIGGADMPVIISMLNAYSGLASVGVGFTMQNIGLIITGSLVGASGAILSYIMCRAMNRSFLNVLLGGFGGETSVAVGDVGERPVKQGSAEDAAFLLKNARSVIIVPGYGLAVAQAQHAVREMTDLLKEEGVQVRYAIHPVAGRMPGHMNVLLAEAQVSYDDVFALEDINHDFSHTDVALVIGANDVTNPAARTDKTSPIYGMPVLDVDKAKTVLFVKRSLSSGYAGVDNPLFYRDNTMMLFGDAKRMAEEIVKAL
jgi:NAD(P) transhydrogenase subunit beta